MRISLHIPTVFLLAFPSHRRGAEQGRPVLVLERGMGPAFEPYPWKRAQTQVEDGSADIVQTDVRCGPVNFHLLMNRSWKNWQWNMPG